MIQNKIFTYDPVQRILNKGHIDYWQKLITFIKHKERKQYICYFLKYKILKAQERRNDGE